MLINKSSSSNNKQTNNKKNNSACNLTFPQQLSVEMLMYSNIQNTSVFYRNPVL